MKTTVVNFLFAAALLAVPRAGTSQTAPPLGAAASFTLFTQAGAFNNVGPSIVNGNIGTSTGAFSGFPPGVQQTGNTYLPGDPFATQAAGDVQNAFNFMSAVICTVSLAGYGGPVTNPQVLTPNSYCVNAATTLVGRLVLDGQGNPNALFFLRVGGALITSANSKVTCINGANPANVYWHIGGRTDLGNNSVMRGTLITDGAINLIQGATLLGRGLSRAGAITVDTGVSALQQSTTWMGGGTTDWFNGTNWSHGVPNGILDAVVPSGTAPYPVINSGSALANSLVMCGNTTLTMGGGTLNIKVDLANNGTISTTGGTVLLNGTPDQLLGGAGSTHLWNVTLTNVTDGNLFGNVGFQGVLNPATGSLATDGHVLTLLSDANGTGLVDNSGTGSINGAATVQRYISTVPYGGPGYRHYSSPVTGALASDLTTATYTPVFNTNYNISTAPNFVTPYPTVLGYDESRVLSSPATTISPFDKGWFSPAISSLLESGRGYSVQIPGSEKVDFVGMLTNGPVPRQLTRANNPNAGWHLLGNPYPSPIDWRLVNIPVGMNSAVYVFESTAAYGGSYRSYLPGVGGQPGIGNPLLPVAQGFFVRATAPTTFTLNNSVRQTTLAPQTAFHRGADTRPLVQLTLRGSSAPALTDEAYVYFQTGATTGIDAQFDALKIQHNNGGAPTLWATAAGTELAINGLPALTSTTTVALGVDVPQAGTFTFEAAQLLNLTTATVYLHDAVTGQAINLRQQPSYSFRASTAGPQAARFSLSFEPARPTATAVGLFAQAVSLYPNPATGSFTLLVPAVAGATQVTATLLNGLGQAVRTQSAALPAAGVQLPFDAAHLASGFYLVRVQAGSAVVTKRVVIQ